MLTERFEFFITQREMGQRLSELNDPVDQRQRLEKQAAAVAPRAPTPRWTRTLCAPWNTGMPPTGGLGFGVDRLIMLLTDSPSIRDVSAVPDDEAPGLKS